ncbi:MAG: sulfotransferase [Thiotrichaceae bacterium]|nr:sulfotransferase [Thiotrichaceae bacterium]
MKAINLKMLLQNINYLLAILDKPFAAKAHPDVLNPLFIVGIPRSGTTLTYQVISHTFQTAYFPHPMDYCYGASNLIHRSLKPWLTRPKANFKSNYGYIDGFLSPTEDAHYWQQWFKEREEQGHYIDPSIINKEEYISLIQNLSSLTYIMKKPFVFKSLYLGMVVGVLAQIFPNALFIKVHRDILLTYQSILTGRFKRKKPELWWSIKPPRYLEWNNLSIQQQIIRQIFHTERIISDDLERYAKGRYCQINYADLCDDPKECMLTLNQWLNAFGQYEMYPEIDLPAQFSISNQLRLSEEEQQVFMLEYNQLQQNYAKN